MTKRAKLWKATMVLLTALAFSLAASAPSHADSLSRVAQWYATVYGTTGPAAIIGATSAAADQATAAATPAGTQGGSSIMSGYNAGYSLNGDERQLLALVNGQRTANNLGVYSVNPELSYLARLRAQDMADNHNLTHYSPTYGTPPQMEEAAGIYGNPMGAENICEGPSVTADNTALFNSPDHRANLLDPRETQIGLGVVRGSDGIVWVSELFLGN